MKALIDGDVLLYQAVHRCSTVLATDDNYYVTAFDKDELLDDFDASVRGLKKELTKKLDKDVGGVVCLSGPSNFRFKVDPQYKANRKDKKPHAFKVLKEAVIERYNPIIQNQLEADDVMGVLHTQSKKKDTVVCSIDKDMQTLPGYFFNLDSGELFDISPKEAEEYHLAQTLIGDRVDNYFGCPSIGPATAVKKFSELGCSWETVVTLFQSKGLTKHDALRNARCAFILQADNYSFDTKRVKLWQPKQLKHCV